MLNFLDTEFLAHKIRFCLFSCDQCTTWVLMDGRNCQEMMLGSYTITTTPCHQPLRNRSWRKQLPSKTKTFFYFLINSLPFFSLSSGVHSIKILLFIFCKHILPLLCSNSFFNSSVFVSTVKLGT